MPVPSSPSYWGFEDNIFESSLDFLLSQTPSHTSSLFTPAVGHQFSINPPASDHSGMAPPLRPALTEHSAEDWEQHKLIFTRLYINEKRSLKDVIKIMEDEHKFRATPRQYKRRIEQWKLDKYIKEDDMKVILRKDLKRKREGKETDFTVAGRNVESQKIRKFAKRNNFTEEEILGFDVESPNYINYETPIPTHLEASEPEVPDLLDHSVLNATQNPRQTIVQKRPRRHRRRYRSKEALMDQFIRKLGVAPPTDTMFDIAVLALPVEIGEMSHEMLRDLIAYVLPPIDI